MIDQNTKSDDSIPNIPFTIGHIVVPIEPVLKHGNVEVLPPLPSEKTEKEFLKIATARLNDEIENALLGHSKIKGLIAKKVIIDDPI